jgi:phosphoenolpyruvate carboxykinase (ATP)
MMSTEVERGRALDREGIQTDRVRWNLTPAALYEEAVRRDEGVIAAEGPLACRTGQHTGRSPNDKFIVREPSSEANIAWGKVNRSMEPAHFDVLHRELISSLSGKELFVQDCYAGADPKYRLPVRIVTELAWHSLFVRHLFIVDPGTGPAHVPEFTVIDSPSFKADPKRHGTNSDVVIAVNFAKKLVLVGGTSYAGEMKKSIFSILNYLLPLRNVLPMHCSANVGREGDVAIFFGLSGTGKTTLSADPARSLIGDDEHGWAPTGTFNYEGGCYAKVINLAAEGEPDIYRTTQMFGTILENVVLDPLTRRVKFEDQGITENTRASYPLHYIPNYVPSGRGGHPKNIIFLTADAFGVLPPIAKLTREQAMYYFLSGYTAKVAGTERGVTEPQATFSSCFGAVFLVWHPTKYADMLGRLIQEHDARVWLVNTGWSGGAFGVGKRMKLGYTRAMVHALLGGALEGMKTRTDPVFGLAVPQLVPGVPTEVLDARGTWTDHAAYDAQARKLAEMFRKNFEKFGNVAAKIRDAGPQG